MLALAPFTLQATLLAASIVVDAPHHQVYVGAPDGTITALALATGATAWTQPQAGQPLVATARGLAVLELDEPHALRVSLRAPRDGQRILQSAPIALPEWVAPGPGCRLDVNVTLDGDALRVAWHARSSYNGGAAPTRETLEAARHDAAGETRVLRDGALAPAPPRPPLPDKLATLATVTVHVGDHLEEHPFRAGNEVVALRQQGDTLLMERYSLAGAKLGRRVLLRGAPPVPSVTGNQLAVVMPGSTPPRTMLFRVPSGLTLATVTVPPGADDVQLADGHVLYVDTARASLEAIDARSGAPQWSHPLPTTTKAPARP